jgi:hypothetical protein
MVKLKKKLIKNYLPDMDSSRVACNVKIAGSER